MVLVSDENMPWRCVCGCFADDHAPNGSCDDCGECAGLEEKTP